MSTALRGKVKPSLVDNIRAKPLLLGFPMPTSNLLVFLHWSTREGVTSQTAVYGPVRMVVWQKSAGGSE